MHNLTPITELMALPISSQITNLTSAKDLMQIDYPEIKFVIDGLLPIGLAMLAAKPKQGKSHMALQLAINVASRSDFLNNFATDTGDVIYYSLEDSGRRLQTRIANILGENPALPANLFLKTKFISPDKPLEAIREDIMSLPNCKLIIIDTVQKVRPRVKNNTNAYQEDYEFYSVLKSLADEFNICILLVHHLRKNPSGDFVDEINGSTGVAASMDTIITIAKERTKSDAVMNITGRDIDEKKIALNFENCLWSYAGIPELTQVSGLRENILKVIMEFGIGEGIKPADIAEKLGRKRGDSSIRQVLGKMLKDGTIRKSDYGKYLSRIADNTNNSDNTDDSNNNHNSNHSDNS